MKHFLILCLILAHPVFSQEESTGYSVTPMIQKKTEPKLPAYFEEEFAKEQKNGNRFYQEFLKMIFYLVLVIAILFIILFLLKKFLHTRSEQMNVQSRIKILEQRALSSKASLYLLKVDDQSLLIAESPTGVHTLTTMQRSFEEVLNKKNETS